MAPSTTAAVSNNSSTPLAAIPSKPISSSASTTTTTKTTRGSVHSSSPSSVRDFVVRSQGRTVIDTVLIANNGIAAVKEIRSVRKWAYEVFGDERAIKFVVMATPEDLQHNAEYIRMSDHYIEVPGGSNNNNYANVDLIVDLAERSSVQAVWAGWGHASENPKLPEKLSQIGVVFIGPSGGAMRSLGDKISSSIVAQAANVPTMPWSGSGLTTDARNDQGFITVPDDIYRKACVIDLNEALARVHEIGFPCMIKASEGGGGKGIRKVTKVEEFSASFRAVQGEVPGSPIFLMALAVNARHLEVQIIADSHGNAISLFGRDCSVQRRHQKIIEEAPVTIADPNIWEQMEMSAVRLAELVGYENAGTVEFLYDVQSSKYYFLELNPRLQVEHPTTEIVSGVNIPAAQLQIAMGIPLHNIRDIRVLYGVPPNSTTPIDFHFENPNSRHSLRKPSPLGHVIACRITAENPDADFKPSSGSIKELNFRSNTNVWGYFSVSADGGLHEFADSQFGHIFAYGHDRSQSRKNMIMALKELSIRGDFRTTVEYLIKLLETSEFTENTFNTSWLDKLIQLKVRAERPELWSTLLTGAVWKAWESFTNITDGYKHSLERGQVLPTSTLKTNFQFDILYQNVKYPFKVALSSPNTYSITLPSASKKPSIPILLTSKPLRDGSLLIQFDQHSYVVYVREDVNGDRITVNGKTTILERENDPTKMRSPSPGKLVRWCVEDGSKVVKGQIVAEIEVMKMYMPLTASEDGVLHPIKQAGTTLEAGDMLATLSLDDPSSIRQADLFTGEIPSFGLPTSPSDKINQRFSELKAAIENALNGYDVPAVEALIKELFTLMRNPELPYLEIQTVMSTLSGRIPPQLETEINKLACHVSASPAEFPAAQIAALIENCGAEVTANTPTFWTTVAPLQSVCQRYKDGLKGHEVSVVLSFLKNYIDAESLFIRDAPTPPKQEDVIISLRDHFKDNLQALVTIILSHSKVSFKNKLILLLIDEMERDGSYLKNTSVISSLESLASVRSKQTAQVALRARESLIQLQLPSIADRQRSMADVLIASVTDEPISAFDSYKHSHNLFHYPVEEKLSDLVAINYSLFDVLPLFFTHVNPFIVLAALETYARRAYNYYNLLMINHHLKTLPKHDRSDDSSSARSQAVKNPRTFIHDDSSDDSDETAENSRKFPFINWHFKYPDSSSGGLNSSVIGSTGIASEVPGNSNSVQSSQSIDESDRIISVSDMTLMLKKGQTEPVRVGAIAAFTSLSDVVSALPLMLKCYPKTKSATSPASPTNGSPLSLCWHILNIVIIVPDSDDTVDDAMSPTLASCISSFANDLRAHGIRRVTFMLYKKGQYPRYFTYREQSNYNEDPNIRNIEPSHSFQLELKRVSNFNITPLFISNRNIHIYYAVGKENAADCRFFVRAIVRPGKINLDQHSPVEYLISEGDRVINNILDALEIVYANYPNTDCNHFFINFIPDFDIDPRDIENSFKGFIERHGNRFWKLRVQSAEVRFLVNEKSSSSDQKSESSACIPYRFVLSNTSGVLKAETYREVKNEKGQWILHSLKGKGELHQSPVDRPYPTKEMVQPKRYKAHSLGTTYVYDYIALFREAIEFQWATWMKKIPSLERPSNVLNVQELDFADNGELKPVNRPVGTNKCGMVAWLVEMFTPEAPNGRKVIVIANDITFQIGSFGPTEDKLFYKASFLARQLGIPRIYISANSGARIGLADEVLQLFKVCWNNENDFKKGFKYLYLTVDDYQRLDINSTKSLNVEEVITPSGEKHMKIIDIIGAKDGLGVENLQGSGLIAGETSRAYDEIFTITLVPCRSVGIGAYLVRLGQRTIQAEGQPIILTGAAALNKVLGREVYTSNLQLGGTQIMFKNGVSHVVVPDAFCGVHSIMTWLSYIPRHRDDELPILYDPSWDPIDRDIAFTPTQAPYDPRHMLAGHTDESGQWVSGFFDKDSFEETLSGWAKTVVVGRARLGGIPMGVIAVETRTMETVVAADPANPDSQEQINMEAAGVWTPSSAYKTAQAINDFNKGEQLPLMIFANWRGFSGGQRDMYDAILKYGSHIVDALRTYQQPIFVYIVPNGELRGGAWVVLDPSINPYMMEMYSDRQGRGGVLEPAGIVEIKYRQPQIISTMERIDPIYRQLKAKLADPGLPLEQKTQFKVEIERRENDHLPIFKQVALQFADLHDTAGRMLAKNVIRDILDWPHARKYFYYHVKKRVMEEQLLKKMKKIHPDLSRQEMQNVMKSWFAKDNNASTDYDSASDEKIISWFEDSKTKIEGHLETLENDFLSSYISRIIKNKPSCAVNGLIGLFSKLKDN